jgi:single-stranded-DNA-specific exonuclease
VNQPLWRTALVDHDKATAIANEHHIPIRVAKWLCVRGVEGEGVRSWLNLDEGGWMPPTVFDDIHDAVERTLSAIARRERIFVVGDYDVDGVTASTILVSTLKALGADVECVIPHRVFDGYGLSVPIVERIQASGGQLLITVDNGIRAHEAVTFAVECGMDVIITDHHEPGESLPETAYTIVHPAKSADDQAAVLSGAGVAWKFSTLLLDTYEQSLDDSGRHSGSQERNELRDWHVCLATLGTLADVMPMRGENRRLVHRGIQMLRTCERPGFRVLCDVAGVDQRKLTETTLLWSITPRLNAAGRMASAETAFQLFMAEDEGSAIGFAEEIERLNAERKAETDRALNEAILQCTDRYGDEVPAGVVVYGNWSLGVVGIVAAKLVERFGRPAIVLADDGSGVLRGSGRAPEGFSLLEAVSACQTYLHHFGGHDSAVGCGVHQSCLSDFIEAFIAAAEDVARASESSDEEHCLADDYLPLAEATLDLLPWVERFAPYGPENPPLSFYLGPLEVVRLTPLGNGKHLRITVREGEQTADLIWFQAQKHAFEWTTGTCICAVAFLESNTWQGVTRVQLRVKEAYVLRQPLLREEFVYLYRLLRARRRLRMDEVKAEFSHRTAQDLKVMLDTFVELGFAHVDESAYHVSDEIVKADLRESSSYQLHLKCAIGGL